MAKIVIKRLLGWIVLIWWGLTNKISFDFKSSINKVHNNNSKNPQPLTKEAMVFVDTFCKFHSTFGCLFEKQLLDMQSSVMGTSSRYLLSLEKVFSPTDLCVSWTYFEESGLTQGKSLILMLLTLLHLQLHGSFWGELLKSKILVLPW